MIEDPGTPPDHLNYVTGYTYDAADNLTSVSQDGQTRTFAYDSAKRLICASNPESRVGETSCLTVPMPTSGLNRYTYDDNGNLVTSTDARNQTTTRQYDSLDRVIWSSFPDGRGGQAQVWSCYDGKTATISGCGGSEDDEMRGVLTGVASTNSATPTEDSVTAYVPDVLGRIVSSTQTTGGVAYAFAYTYNADGSLETEQYPSGRVVAYSYDRAARPATVGPTVGASTYAEVGYKPHGAIETLTFGSGLVESWEYDEDRLQPTSMTVGSLLTLGFGYGASATNNGNMLQQTIAIPGMSTLTQVYRYDQANRLRIASENSSNPSNPSCPDAGSLWCQGFGYDARGNRRVVALSGIGPSLLEASSFDAKNRAPESEGWLYDAAGNLTKVPPALTGHTMAYDGQNRQVAYCTQDPSGCVKQAGTGRTLYAYDGEGRRVKKVLDSGVTTTYVYDALGRLAAEYGGAPPPTSGRVFLTADHLGSTRLVTNAGGNPAERTDYYPYGDEILSSTGSPRLSVTGYTADSGIQQKFTGKERDAETGLDYFLARYYSAAQGRFTSPDEFTGGIVDAYSGGQVQQSGPLPYADITDPQTLNKYAYVRNNPLRYTDPDGHCTDVLTCGIALGEATTAFGGYVTAAAGGAVGGLIVYLASPAVGGSGGPSPNPGHYFAESVDNSIAMSRDAQAQGRPAQAQGQQSTPADPQDDKPRGPVKAKDAPGVTAGGQATNEHGQKLAPSGRPQVNNVSSNTREAARNKANKGSGTVEDKNPARGQPHFHTKRGTGEKKRDNVHYNYPE